jgi:hypothetical protein
MAKRSYLAGYKESDRRGMISRMPDVVKGSTDLSPEAAAMHKAYIEPLRTPSLDDLHSRWKGDKKFIGPLHEYPAELKARKEVNEKKLSNPVVMAAIKRKQLNDRKLKGYNIEQLLLDKMGGAILRDDELEAIRLVGNVRKSKDAEIKLEKLIAELSKELEEEKSMRNSFDRRTRMLYSGTKVQNMEADIERLMVNLANQRAQTEAFDTEMKYWFDVRPKHEKGKDFLHWNKPGVVVDGVEKPKEKVVLIKKEKE